MEWVNHKVWLFLMLKLHSSCSFSFLSRFHLQLAVLICMILQSNALKLPTEKWTAFVHNTRVLTVVRKTLRSLCIILSNPLSLSLGRLTAWPLSTGMRTYWRLYLEGEAPAASVRDLRQNTALVYSSSVKAVAMPNMSGSGKNAHSSTSKKTGFWKCFSASVPQTGCILNMLFFWISQSHFHI